MKPSNMLKLLLTGFNVTIQKQQHLHVCLSTLLFFVDATFMHELACPATVVATQKLLEPLYLIHVMPIQNCAG